VSRENLEGLGRNSKPPIFLVGFMGAGKTTVGQALADRLGYCFFDLDRIIEENVGKSVALIFSEQGEQEFRRLETEALERCRDLTGSIIALGGGAYVLERNRAILRGIGRTIWLDCPLKVCFARISGDPARPLLRSEREMSELLEHRLPAYTQADYIVPSGENDPGQVAEMIIEILGL